jgi:hypothetical protein
VSLPPEQKVEKALVQEEELVGGPLMEELRLAAGEEPEMGDLQDNAPRRDYGALIEQELKTPIGGEGISNEGEAVPTLTVAHGSAPTGVPAQMVTPPMQAVTPPPAPPVNNLATQAVPTVPNSLEINGVPAINYAQAPVDVPAVMAPINTQQAYMNTVPQIVMSQPNVAPMQMSAPVPASVPMQAAMPAVEPVASPLPMPNMGALPPPPPPFDPNVGAMMSAAPAQVVSASVAPPAVAQAPMQTVQALPTVQPMMQTVQPIQPAAPAMESQPYLGSNQAMPDQVYPQIVNNDPSAFQLPH